LGGQTLDGILRALGDAGDVILKLLRYLVARLAELGYRSTGGLTGVTQDLEGGLCGSRGLLGVLLELLQDLIGIGTLRHRRGRGDGVVDALDRTLAELKQTLRVGAQLVADARAQVVEEDGARHLNHARLNALRL
jgi:hypothetical protein